MSKEKMLCIYHGADFDGFGSAAIVEHFCAKEYDITFKPMDYKDVPYMLNDEPGNYEYWSRLFNVDQVLIVDFSLPWEVLKKFTQAKTVLTIIDHHSSAKKHWEETAKERVMFVHKNPEYQDTFNELFTSSGSAVRAVWSYFQPDEPLPLIFEFIEKYDLYEVDEEHKLVIPVQLGLKHHIDIRRGILQDSFERLMYCNDHLDEMIHIGSIMMERDKMLFENIELTMTFAFLDDDHDYCYLIGFVPRMLTNEFSKYLLQKYPDVDFIVCLQYDPNKELVCYELRGRKPTLEKRTVIDLSVIASQNDGGGHFSAAGFYRDFELDGFFI